MTPFPLDILSDLNIRIETGVALGPSTWYGVGGPAKVLAHPASEDQLAALTQRCLEQNVPVYVLGSGANLLVADEGIEGVVVALDEPFFSGHRIEGTTVIAGSGYDLQKLVRVTARAGLVGLEVLAGIPGSVGGGIRMNAGGTFGEIGPAVKRLRLMDANGEIYERHRDNLRFDYRKTNIVASYILEAEFDLNKEDPEQLVRRVKEIFLYKKNTQPLAEHSAGCAFKNPMMEPATGRREPAGKLIDQAGLKGFRIGGAEVSDRHANFIFTHKGGTASDVLAVLDHVQKTILEHCGIELEREVVVWP